MEAAIVRRTPSESKWIHNFSVQLYIFLEPVLNVVAFFCDQGSLLLDFLVRFFQICARKFDQLVPGPYHTWRVKARDLQSERFLGQGFSGVVYETTWSGKRCARKDFPGVQSKVFVQEAAALVKLDHPNIVKTFCWTVDKRSCSLVVEYMSDDLKSIVQKKKYVQNTRVASGITLLPDTLGDIDKDSPFLLLEAIEIMLQIAIGMKYLHAKGVAHGDLKPNNILVNQKASPMIVKVGDFGLTQTKKTAIYASNHARYLEMIAWKAPEITEKIFEQALAEDSDDFWVLLNATQVEDWPSAIDVDNDSESRMLEADVYSFALTCSYILSGEESYYSDLRNFVVKVRKNILSDARPDLPSACPQQLRDLIQSSWDRNTRRRPTFSDICRELQLLKSQLLQPGGTLLRITTMQTSIEDQDRVPREGQAYSSCPDSTPSYFHTTRMMQRKSEFASEIELEIEVSKVHWSEAIDYGDYRFTNRELLDRLHKQFGSFFEDHGDRLVLGQKIGEGGQAEIFEAKWTGWDGKKLDRVLKVFKKIPIYELQKQWPLGLVSYYANKQGFRSSRLCQIFGGTVLQDDTFAFLMERYWGDLRHLIDIRMRHNNTQGPPFQIGVAIAIMRQIAEGMDELHSVNIMHRDLKASNVFVRKRGKLNEESKDDSFSCVVGDFECSVGMIGTGFWRPPEVLRGLKERNITHDLFTPKGDVYSYAMTCYEILTGRIPFEGHRYTDYSSVINGERPDLPDYVDPQVKALLNRCWKADPSERPTFKDILAELMSLREVEEKIPEVHRQVGMELPGLERQRHKYKTSFLRPPLKFSVKENSARLEAITSTLMSSMTLRAAEVIPRLLILPQRLAVAYQVCCTSPLNRLNGVHSWFFWQLHPFLWSVEGVRATVPARPRSGEGFRDRGEDGAWLREL